MTHLKGCKIQAVLWREKKITHSILKSLIGRHVAGARWMDPSTSGTNTLVLLHHVNKSDDRLWLEVDVPVKCKQEGVLCSSLKS